MANIRRQEFVCTVAELALYPNVILALNEFLYVRQEDGKLKMMAGDGETAVSELPYSIDIGAMIEARDAAVVAQGLAQQAVLDALAEKQEAITKATEAFNSAADAHSDALSAALNKVLALSYAVGGTESRDGEETDNAKYFKEVVAQAMADFLHMLGNSVATLDENGKLTPGQIPNLSINNVETVTSVEDMLLLTDEDIQYGDAVLLKPETVITDSYLFTGTDRADITHYSKLGVSYVANAGHAVNADQATNADKINNMRFVAMVQSQYDVAVTEDETNYIVVPG